MFSDYAYDTDIPALSHYNRYRSIAQLRARRLECLRHALVAYHLEHIALHHGDASRWTEARQYWTAEAYAAQGEILARTDSTVWY